MATLASLLIKLGADTSGFHKEIDKSGGRLSKWAGNVQKNFQTLGKVAVAGVGIAAGAAVAGGVALTKFALDAAELQTIEAAFQGIAAESEGGSAAMLAALQKGSAGMVAQKDLMLTYNKAAQLVGTTFANQLPDAMQYLQKVSAATGQDMGFLLDSLTVGVGRLSPMILDNLAIQVSLSEASERAAKMFGVEAKELTKAQQQAGMMNVVLEKLQKNTEAMPDVSNSAAAGIARMQARWQDTKDTLGKAFLPVLVTVMGVITKLADKVIPIVVDWVGRLSNAVNYIMRGFTMFEWTISDFFSTAEDGTTRIGTFLNMLGLGEETADAVGRAINTVAQTITGLIETVMTATEPVREWIAQNITLKDMLIGLGLVIMISLLPSIWSMIGAGIAFALAWAPVIAVILVVIGAVALLRKAWEKNFLGIRDIVATVLAEVRKYWDENGAAILAKAKEVFETVRQVITDVMNKVKAVIDQALILIQAWWAEHGAEVMAKVREFMSKAQATITEIINTIKSIITEVLNGIQSFWDEHGEQIKRIVEEFMELVKVTIEQIINTVSSIIEDVLNGIRDFWDAHGAEIEALADGAWQAIQDIVDSALDIIEGIIEGAIALIEGDWDTFGQKLEEIWDAAWAAVKSIIVNVIPALLELIGGLIGDIKDKITSVDWGKLGKAIINGIADGVKAAAGALARAALQAAKDALEAVRRWLGIDSPSRVFFEQVGRPMIEGWAMGVADTRPLERAIADVAARSFAVAAQLAPTSPGIGNTFNLSAQYRYQEERTLAQDVRFLQLLYGK